MAEGNSLKEILRDLVENERSIIGRPEELIGKVDAALKLPALKKGKIINPLKMAVLTAKIGEGFLVADNNPAKRSEAIDGARKSLRDMNIQEERVNEIVEAFTYAMNWDAFGMGSIPFDGIYGESEPISAPVSSSATMSPASTDYPTAPAEKSFAEMMQEMSETERNEMLFGTSEASREPASEPPIPKPDPEPAVSEPVPEQPAPEPVMEPPMPVPVSESPTPKSVIEPSMPEPAPEPLTPEPVIEPAVPEALPEPSAPKPLIEPPMPEPVPEPPTTEPVIEPAVSELMHEPSPPEPAPEQIASAVEFQQEADGEEHGQAGRRRRRREPNETGGEEMTAAPEQEAESGGRGRRRRPLANDETADANTSAPIEIPARTADHEKGSGRRRRQNLQEQTIVVPEVSQEPAKKQGGSKKALVIAGIVAIVLIGGFFAYGPIQESRYNAKREDFVRLMTEAGASMKALGSGDEKSVARIMSSVEDLASLKKSLPDSKSPDRSQWLSAIEKNEVMMIKAKAVLDAGKSENSAEKLHQLYAEYQSAVKEAEAAGGELRLDGRKLNEAIPYADLNAGMGAYVSEKMKTNQEYLAKTLASYKEQLDAQNAMLKGKGEVVFLTESVSPSGTDIVLHGRFYNGTADFVSGIGEMLVDVTLKQFDTTVAEIKDVPYQSGSLSSLSLQPGTNTEIVSIVLSGKAPEGMFNHFDVHVHKIHWKIRRAVRN